MAALKLPTAVLAVIVFSLVVTANAAFSHCHSGSHAESRPTDSICSGGGVDYFAQVGTATHATILALLFAAE
jgi:hypothetical protein